MAHTDEVTTLTFPFICKYFLYKTKKALELGEKTDVSDKLPMATLTLSPGLLTHICSKELGYRTKLPEFMLHIPSPLLIDQLVCITL